jgi:hypothetical protein
MGAIDYKRRAAEQRAWLDEQRDAAARITREQTVPASTLKKLDDLQAIVDRHAPVFAALFAWYEAPPERREEKLEELDKVADAYYEALGVGRSKQCVGGHL